jgi:hypothetical protein
MSDATVYIKFSKQMIEVTMHVNAGQDKIHIGK